MKKTLLVLGLLSCFSCYADEMSLDIGLKAYHWNREAAKQYNLNEDNPGIGLRWSTSDNYYHQMLGVYKNSDRVWSKYALMAYTPVKLGNVQIGAVAGVLTGYSSPYQPAAGLYTVVKATEEVSVNVTMVPTIRSIKCWGFAGFQLSVKF